MIVYVVIPFHQNCTDERGFLHVTGKSESVELSGDRREESVMTDMKKNIKRTAVLSVVLVLMSATTVFGAEQTEEYVPAVYATFWALVPPVVAIGLALITKEVYSSLFVGVLMGGILYSGFSFEGTITHIFEDGMINVLSDSYNVGILIFLVILGTMVCLMNRAGGSAAFGQFAAEISVDLAEAFADLFCRITFNLGSKAAADELSHPSCGDFLCKVIGKDVIGRCRAEISLFFHVREGAVGVVAPVRGGGILRRFIQCVEDLRGSHLDRGSVLFLGRLQAFLHEFLSFRHIISPVVHALHRGDHHVAGRFGSRNLIVPVVEKLFVGGAAGFRVGHPVRLIVVVKLRRNRVCRQLMFKFPCFHKESPSFQL